MQPQIFLANTPSTAHARRSLRVHALDLHSRLNWIGDGPCVALLNLEITKVGVIDLVLLRPRSVLVGLFKEAEGPVEIGRDHPWLVEARAARAAVLEALGRQEPGSQAPKPISPASPSPVSPAQLGTPIAAVIVMPVLHAESRIQLDIEDHRQRIKLLGLDEVAPLAAMLQASAQLDEASMLRIAAQLGGMLWHDGQRLRFEIGRAPFELHVLSGEGQQRHMLLEGANILGRRIAPLQYEYRLSFPDDDSISADHAMLVCAPDGRVILRDTSTNGSYIRLTSGGEERVHHAERVISSGATLRIGETLLRLEAL